MSQIITTFQFMYAFCRARLAETVDLEEGSVAEKVVLTALFVALAIVAGTIIYNAVKTKASSISYNTPNN